MCVAQPENSDEPIYSSCIDREKVVRLTRALLQPEEAAVQAETAHETHPEDDSDEASLYFNRKR